MKTLLLTGASGNMGQAVARKFLNEGYQVTGTRAPGDRVELSIADPAFQPVTVNLLEEESAAAMVSDLVAANGCIDVAVLTVGGFAMGDIASTGSADLLQQYQLNFQTTYQVARPVFKQMLKQGYGRIFLVGSRPGLDMRQGKGMTAYALAKSLVFRLAELMNEEARQTNVVTAVLVPSTIDTPQNRAAMPEADFSQWVSPDAIADTLFFYCSPEAAPLREPVLKLYGGA